MNETEQEIAAAERRARLRALYARAFDEYGTRALWNMRRFEEPEPSDVLAMTRQLRIEGNLSARRLAEQIEMLIRAGHLRAVRSAQSHRGIPRSGQPT